MRPGRNTTVGGSWPALEQLPLCGCRWPTFCDLCAPIEHQEGRGPCPECAVPADGRRTHLHIVSRRQVVRVPGKAETYHMG